MNKGILNNQRFYCEHIGDSHHDVDDIDDFTVRHAEYAGGLRDYIREWAASDEEEHLMRTYLVREVKTDELVGYFSLKAGMASLNERVEHYDDGIDNIEFDAYPGIEIANFAMNATYLSKHPTIKGLGILVFREFILRLAKQAADIIGVNLLYIYALPYDDLIKRYRDVYCFERLSPESEEALHARVKPSYDMNCIFMYQLL